MRATDQRDLSRARLISSSSSSATHGKTSASLVLCLTKTCIVLYSVLIYFSGTHLSPHEGVSTLNIRTPLEQLDVNSIITALPGDTTVDLVNMPHIKYYTKNSYTLLVRYVSASPTIKTCSDSG